MSRENWKPIILAGQPTNYQVSDRGRVRNLQGYTKTQTINRNGRPVVKLYVEGEKHLVHVAFLVTTAFIGPRPKGLTIDHKNGKKTDNRLKNLEYVTISENILRSYKRGRKRPGGRRYLSKGTYQRIREVWKTGKYSQLQVARLFNVSNTLISRFANGILRFTHYGTVELYPDYDRLDPRGLDREFSERVARGMMQ